MTSTFIAFWEDVVQHRQWKINHMGRPNCIDFCDELATLLESRFGTTYSAYYLRDKLSHFRLGHIRGKAFARPYAASLDIINETLENRRRLWELHCESPEIFDPKTLYYDLEICGLSMEDMMDVAEYMASRTSVNHGTHFYHHICSHFPPKDVVATTGELTPNPIPTTTTASPTTSPTATN